MITQDDEGAGSETGTSGTKIDLGDDLLLEKTRVLVRPEKTAPEPAPPVPIAPAVTPHDLLQNARILLSEGFLEEAKRALRQVLIQDASNAEARKHLEEIHARELKQIFGEGEPIRARYGRSNVGEGVNHSEAERIGDRLEEDLQLSLVEECAELKQFAETIENHVRGTSPQDRVDLGVAFLEMGLYDVAEKLFTSGIRDEATRISATALLAYTQIRAGKYYEASVSVQPILHDADVKDEEKVEFFYLVGRAYEGLGQPQVADRWYRQVADRDSDYRDVQARLRK